MKKIAIKLLAVLTACTFTACSTVSVTTNYDHAAPFAKYKTYTLAEAPSGKKLSPESQEVLRKAIRTQLAARGVTEAKQGKGDLAIVWNVITKDKVSVQEYTDWGYNKPTSYGSTTWPYVYGAYGMWEGAPRTYTNVSSYTEGTLLIDAVDTHTNKLVFRGAGTAVVGGQKSNARKIEKAVAQMVAALPTKNR